MLRPRRSARLTALMNGGVIPETGDFRVVKEPDGAFIGTVNEDFAIESQAGDIFLLGTTLLAHPPRRRQRRRTRRGRPRRAAHHPLLARRGARPQH